jgi:predicted nucleic acid-binding protein
VRQGELEGRAAEDALADLRALDLERHSHEPLLGRVGELRQNLTSYDAVYVALAEALEAKLVTCDAKLSHAPGVGARNELVEALRR